MTKTNYASFRRMANGLLFFVFTCLFGSVSVSAQSGPVLPNPQLPSLQEKALALTSVDVEINAQIAVIVANPDETDPAMQAASRKISALNAFRHIVTVKNTGVQEALAVMNVPELPDGQTVDIKSIDLLSADWNAGNFSQDVAYLVDIIKE